MLMLDLWKKQPGEYFCISTKSITGKWEEKFIRRGEWDRAKRIVRENMDKDLYMCPHGFSQPKRRKGFAVDPKMLYADLDEADPRDLILKPTIAIESSPGRFVGYWLTKQPADETLNRRMSYSIEADKSGWDRTQVLRIPNTRNYKYDSTPRVRILWTDGPIYDVDQLEKEIPTIAELQVDEGTIDEEAVELFKKYEEKMSSWARREVFRQEVTHGKRSEVIWKLNNHLLEAGMTREEAFKLLWISPWNKFRERRGGADQLWKELDKALAAHMRNFKVDIDQQEEEKGWTPLSVSMAEIEPEEIEWIIPGMIARKELTIVEGDPGLGKSYFVQMVAGCICDGKILPFFGDYKATQGKVAYFDTENTSRTVTKPRLLENGVMHLENYFQEETGFSVDEEDRWNLVIEQISHLKPELVVFDTINTYIGSTDTYRSSETQQAMGYFKEIATRFNCAVVVLRHLTKGSKTSALYRGQGSIAFTGAARIVATVGRDPEDPETRVVACTKNNISMPFKSFTYTIEGLPDTLKRKNRSKLVWGEESSLRSDDILTPAEKKPDSPDRIMEKTTDWLKNLLESKGKVDQEEVYAKGETRSFTKATIRRAAEKLEVDRHQSGRGSKKKVVWSLLYTDA